jgi:chromate transporter
MWTIFLRFISLGLVSFGGPAAHIGYFRQTFVHELGWLDENRYASLVALSQFLPGPGSSQVGFAIGYHRGGLAGAVAAFLGFTLPSFLLMYFLAVTSAQWFDNELFRGAVHGLKLMAVVIVADAVVGMYRQFCQRRAAKVLMLLGAVGLLVWPSMLLQLCLLLASALLGVRFFRPPQLADHPSPLRLNLYWLFGFVVLLLLSLFGSGFGGLAQLGADFYRVGSLVFGGGHVVLPLLQASVGDSLSPERFLTGYALAQAVPGPMFTLATFLGAELWLENPPLGAAVATLAIFLPGFLLMLVVLHSWQAICERPRIASALAGINACVVGLLLAALFQPVFVSAVTSPIDMALVLLGFGAIKLLRLPVLWLVLGYVGVGMVATLLG